MLIWRAVAGHGASYGPGRPGQLGEQRAVVGERHGGNVCRFRAYSAREVRPLPSCSLESGRVGFPEIEMQLP